MIEEERRRLYDLKLRAAQEGKAAWAQRRGGAPCTLPAGVGIITPADANSIESEDSSVTSSDGPSEKETRWVVCVCVCVCVCMCVYVYVYAGVSYVSACVGALFSVCLCACVCASVYVRGVDVVCAEGREILCIRVRELISFPQPHFFACHWRKVQKHCCHAKRVS